MAGACCISGSEFAGTPAGTETCVGGVDCYVARPAGGVTPKKALFVLTDVFGWGFANPRLLADRYAAAAGVLVLVPDLHDGDSIASDALDCMLKPATSWAHRLSNVLVALVRVPFSLIPWLLRHGDAATLPRLQAVAAGARAELGVERIATIGFCWGGRYAVLTGGGAPFAADAVLVAHPPTWARLTWRRSRRRCCSCARKATAPSQSARALQRRRRSRHARPRATRRPRLRASESSLAPTMALRRAATRAMRQKRRPYTPPSKRRWLS